MQVELGPGFKPHPQTDIGIDLTAGKGAPPQDAADPPATWRAYSSESPPEGEHAARPRGCILSESVDHVYCSHFMEHVPKGAPTVHVLNEAWRVLKPGGAFTMLCPVIGVTLEGQASLVNAWEPYADPTHVQGWWLPQSWQYFTGQVHYDAQYGIREWRPLPVEPASVGSVAATLAREAGGEHVGDESFWTLRFGWEAIVRLVKP